MKIILLYLTVCFFGTTVYGQATSGHWSVAKEIPLGGDGGWDYLAVDGADQHLFVTHGDHVLVLDLKTDAVVASLDSTGAHGVALAPELNRGFISNGKSGMVTIFDLKTLKPIQSVKVGEGPDAICYEPATKRVFAFNGHSLTASVLDAASAKVVGEISLPGRPEFAQADGSGFVYDNIEDKGLVIKIDAAKMAVVAQWPLPPGSQPSALAIDSAGQRLFAGCDKQLHVLDSQTGRVVASLPIGDGVDAATYDPVQKHIFASCGDGTMTVIKEESSEKYSVEAQVPTAQGARTMAFDASTQTAYLPAAKFGPPPASSADHPHPWHSILPGSFKLLIVK